MVSYEDVKRVKDRHQMDLMRLGATTVALLADGSRVTRSNMVGVGVGKKFTGGRETDELSIAVSVIRKLPESSLRAGEIIPREIEGIKIDVDEVGVILAPPPIGAVGRRSRMRPARGGCSIGHYSITAGTFGCLVSKLGRRYIISNNHVLANENRGVRGDAILQPGSYDGGSPADKIAELDDFIRIDFYGINRVDAAIAKPVDESDVSPDIIDIGVPSDTARAVVGTPVVKSGRTTGVTHGRIIRTDYTVRVEYSGGKTALFENQLATWKISEGGDSGSVVLVDDGSRKVCGLLFAGSERITVINRIKDVFSALNVSI